MNFYVRETSNTPALLWTYIIKALKESFEGEILTLMVAGTYHLIYKDRPGARVEVHPVNQSGASGREVSDLDIYVDNELISSNEVNVPPPIEAGASCFSENSTTNSEELWRLTLSPQA